MLCPSQMSLFLRSKLLKGILYWQWFRRSNFKAWTFTTLWVNAWLLLYIIMNKIKESRSQPFTEEKAGWEWLSAVMTKRQSQYLNSGEFIDYIWALPPCIEPETFILIYRCPLFSFLILVARFLEIIQSNNQKLNVLHSLESASIGKYHSSANNTASLWNVRRKVSNFYFINKLQMLRKMHMGKLPVLVQQIKRNAWHRI